MATYHRFVGSIFQPFQTVTNNPRGVAASSSFVLTQNVRYNPYKIFVNQSLVINHTSSQRKSILYLSVANNFNIQDSGRKTLDYQLYQIFFPYHEVRLLPGDGLVSNSFAIGHQVLIQKSKPASSVLSLQQVATFVIVVNPAASNFLNLIQVASAFKLDPFVVNIPVNEPVVSEDGHQCD